MMKSNTGIKKEVWMTIFELAKMYHIDKVILFGSRARGDYEKVSDIDLAITGGETVKFALDVEENAPTLLKFDIINLDGSVRKELRSSIEKEGVTIYEKI